MELVTENPLVVVASVPAILALVNLLKVTFGIPGKWNALVAVLIGVVVYGYVAIAQDTSLVEAIPAGLLAGLAAAGLFDTTAPGSGVIETIDL